MEVEEDAVEALPAQPVAHLGGGRSIGTRVADEDGERGPTLSAR
jgi:hypothetical protein